jgi:hypothetical protein
VRGHGDLNAEGAAEVNEPDDQLIEGLKLIRLNTARINEPDDPSYPYKLDMNLSPPELMQVTFVMLHGGSEELVVRSMNREAIDKFIEANDLRRHPRLRRMTITGPNNFQEVISR